MLTTSASEVIEHCQRVRLSSAELRDQCEYWRRVLRLAGEATENHADVIG